MGAAGRSESLWRLTYQLSTGWILLGCSTSTKSESSVKEELRSREDGKEESGLTALLYPRPISWKRLHGSAGEKADCRASWESADNPKVYATRVEVSYIFGGRSNRRLRLLTMRVVEESARRVRSDRKPAVAVLLHLGLQSWGPGCEGHFKSGFKD